MLAFPAVNNLYSHALGTVRVYSSQGKLKSGHYYDQLTAASAEVSLVGLSCGVTASLQEFVEHRAGVRIRIPEETQHLPALRDTVLGPWGRMEG